ncbi:TIGR03773 family transporter-associated surface protein [Actinoplanes auranticolor]|uniref:ABC transporter-associated repeat protein n=1 Tax=Actinoplanes auranticolor TaxID=47988 RepID=A0A919VXA5_9ACTN|nr:TIGR03773 family transporter-associated surface protein [Actinoplanes auranticolor]GIM80471.1 hypothetical protein Aau02nite_90720 [Actinoplanes auranticolor]
MIRRTVAVAAASLVVALTAGAPAVAAPGTPQAEGADLVALSVKSGKLRMSFRSESRAVTDPQSLRFTASGSPVGVIPDDPAFAFLGRPGAPVWSLQDGSPFSTFDTTAIDTDDVAGGAVTLDLLTVDGPGSFAAYTLSEWGRPTLLLDSDGRTSARLPAGKRLGGVVWLFDATGEYRVTLRATARTGSRTLKDEAVYAVSVPTRPLAAPETAAAPRIPAPARAAAAAPNRTTAAAAANTPATGRRVIADGHVDMGPQLSGGALRIRLKDDTTTPATWRELSDVTLKVTDKARIDVPAGPGYAFLGKAGDKVYLLPQSQQSGIVWPGWNTQHESLVKGTRGTVNWRLKQVSGPGKFKLFLTGSFGAPEVIFDSDKSLPQRLGIAPNTHAHGNWAFTRAGTYQLTFDMTATTTAGKNVSDTRTLTLAVGDSTDAGAGNGNGTDSATGKGSAGQNGGSGLLARTGANITTIAAGGALLLVAGTAAVLLTRRRRGEAGHVSTPDPSS